MRPGTAIWVIAIACLGASAHAGQLSVSAVVKSSVVHPEIWPSATWPISADPAMEKRIAVLLARMTPEEKVGQIIQADLGSVTPEDLRHYHLGSILNGGSSGPYGDDLAAPPKWLQLADEMYAASVDRSDGGVGIPILWGTDAVHGHSNIVGATLFPHNIGLGAARDPDLIERIGAATAAEVRTTGQEWTFAPTITVPQDYRWGRAYEGYSSDPELVASYANRMVLGLQGAPDGKAILAGPHVLASTKHFIGDGGTFEGRDQGDARISEETLRDIHGRPYGPAVEAGVGTVMTSFSSWQGEKMAGHKGLVTDVLKGRMHFGGFVVTDWNAHGQVTGCTNSSCSQALEAGIDMYMAPDTWRPLYASLLAQVKDGTIHRARLDDAVSRILRVKMQMGLFEAGKPSSRPLAGQWSELGSSAHRAIAREAVGKSLVLLKNTGVLPLKPAATILVAGDGADDVARQSGGWTLSWQGTGLDPKNFPGATTIWGGIRAAVAAAGGHAELAPDGRFTRKPDAAIVIFGETPYAEFQGDLETLQLRPALTRPLETMRRLKAQGIPVIAVMLTGRPLFVSPELNTADAFVVAWLPGSEGAGIADRLFSPNTGSSAPFTGKLPAAWPASAQPGGPALFPFGYGLSGRERAGRWKQLSEDSGVKDTGSAGIFLDVGAAAPGWSLQVGNGDIDTTRITRVPAEGLGGRIKVSAVDYKVQEGARRFDLAGGGLQIVNLHTQEPIDLTRETNGDAMLVTTMRLETTPDADTTISIRCGAGCRSQVALAPARLPVGEWVTLGIPLKCFAKNARMDHIETPFALETRSPLRFSLARVAIGTVAQRTLACPN